MMQAINTLSATLYVLDWLHTTCYPRILHVFDQASNLINERGEVLSVVTLQVGNGPFNLVVGDNILFSGQLTVESPITISADQLHLGGLIIDTAHARLWDPRPDWEKLYIKRDEIHYQLMSLREPQFATKQSPDQFGECSGQTSAALPKTIPIIHELISSLVIADAPASSVSAKQLAGLGVGLTPSGDDLMLGAVYATWIIHPYDTAKALAEEIANIAAPLTTSLSAAWLRSAGRGEAGILWHQFFDALITAEHTQIQEATDNILAVGETSGADALMGFMKTFENWGRVKAD